MLSIWSRLKFWHEQHNYVILEQIQSICRQPHKNDEEIGLSFGEGRKHCGKRRNWWLTAFSPFPAMFSKAFFLKAINWHDCVVTGSLFRQENFRLVQTGNMHKPHIKYG